MQAMEELLYFVENLAQEKFRLSISNFGQEIFTNPMKRSKPFASIVVLNSYGASGTTSFELFFHLKHFEAVVSLLKPPSTILYDLYSISSSILDLEA